MIFGHFVGVSVVRVDEYFLVILLSPSVSAYGSHLPVFPDISGSSLFHWSVVNVPTHPDIWRNTAEIAA